jgi:hypothetical protein
MVVTEVQESVNQTIIELVDENITITSAGDGFGSLKIYDFPYGVIRILGAITSLNIARVGTHIDADADAVAAIGTIPCDTSDSSLTGTKADIVPSMAATLVAGVVDVTGIGYTAATFDGTATAVDANLNIIVPDADIDATNDAVTVNGIVIITWINLGAF